MEFSLPGSSVHGILEGRVLEWVAIFFSRRSSLPRDRGIEPVCPAMQADSFPAEPLGKPYYHDKLSNDVKFLNFVRITKM